MCPCLRLRPPGTRERKRKALPLRSFHANNFSMKSEPAFVCAGLRLRILARILFGSVETRGDGYNLRRQWGYPGPSEGR